MATENSLGQLNEYLFDELSRLSTIEDGDDALIEAEIKRSKAICEVASTITSNAKVILAATRLRANVAGPKASMPKLLGE